MARALIPEVLYFEKENKRSIENYYSIEKNVHLP